ncbi:MAG: 2-C-methyl-D-erythritol 2,4-cyclodiphosphate synthase [Clostridiales bacterium]|nr:2-C-methyl-D-erythritol 2,4-cyclodiphosphate synthase [Clostridiales bacterium]
MSCWAIIAAAGSGSRMGGDTVKTLQKLQGRAVICYSVERLGRACDGVMLCAREEDIPAYRQAVEEAGLRVDRYVLGGLTRRDSVRNALNSLPEDCDLVLVHDGARPLVSDALIERVKHSAAKYGSGVPALPVTDTVKRVNVQGLGVETLQRSVLRTVQTPQGFHRKLLVNAHREVIGPASDDASLVEQLDIPVHLVEGDMDNIKLTLPGDLERAEALLEGRRQPRVGLGFDVHRLVQGRLLVLGGVNIPHEKGLLGHSDADVATHALIDALLGAAALGDIGQHYPDTDERWRGADSVELLRDTVRTLGEKGFHPYNADITIAAQAPRLLPHVPQMRANLARAMGLPPDRVSVKATTTEELGFEGRGEGISARAVALIRAG